MSAVIIRFMQNPHCVWHRTPDISRRNKMGRPINSKYFFNNDNSPLPGASVTSLTFSNLGTGYFAANVGITVSAPNLPLGVQATVSSITLFGNGAINTYTISGGQGYTSATASVTGTNTTPAGISAVGLAQTSGSLSPKLAMTAWIPLGASAKICDILKQESSRRYRVQTSDGVGAVRLTAPGLVGWNSGVTAGYAQLIATDANGSTYYVAKLSGQRALLIQNVQNGSFLYSTDTSAKWTLTGSAVAPAGGLMGVVTIASE